MLSIVAAIVIGFVVGLIARAVMPGSDKAGFIVTVALGIGGSLLATFGGQAIGLYGSGEPAGFVGSLIGAVALLVGNRFLRKQT